MKHYYFAYGSNLHVRQMRKRCPDARLCIQAVLKDYRLVFRGVADVVPEPGAEVQGVIWKISDDCLRALDLYEGYPTLYDRKKVWVYVPEIDDYSPALVYFMVNSGRLSPPGSWYLGTILEGYKNCGLVPKRDVLKPNMDVAAETKREIGLQRREREIQRQLYYEDWERGCGMPDHIKPRLRMPMPNEPDGNAFVILGMAYRAAKNAGWSDEKINKFMEEAKSKDYGHLRNTAHKYFETY